MAKSSFMDTFDLCWNAILMESKQFNNGFFNENNCSFEESRDINFDKVENRLAYVYKFGCFNIHFVRKCIESFLDNYPEGVNLFARENLKVCSLSNGPGLDLIGLLCAVYESNKCLKCFPVLKTINLYSSWWNICKSILFSVYQVTSSSYANLEIPSEIIHLIQSDIYSTIHPEAEDCIRDSDILLMVKVFASTKATQDVVVKSMLEIFSLLKPGSFVFFVGSKKNTKELAANDSLSRFVNCILGPTKISITDLIINETIVNSIDVKPKQSGHAYFIVWQKKDIISPEDIPKKKKRKTRRKKNKSKVTEIQNELMSNTTVSSELADDIDTCSEISFSSCSKQSETTSDEFKTASYENILQSASLVDINTENLNLVKEQNVLESDVLSSIHNITSILDKIHIQPLGNKGENVKDMQNTFESGICSSESSIQESEFQNCMIKKEVVIQTISQNDFCNEINIKQPKDVKTVLNEISSNPQGQLVGESNFNEMVNIKPTPDLGVEQNLIQKCVFPAINNSYYLGKSNMGHSCNEESTCTQAIQPNTILSINESIPKRNTQVKKVETPIIGEVNVHTHSNVKQANTGELLASKFSKGKDSFVLNEYIFEASTSHSSSRKSSVNEIHQADTLLPIIQNKNGKKEVGNNEIMKVNKTNKEPSVIKKIIRPQMLIENKNKNKNGFKRTLENQLPENLMEFKKNTVAVNEEKTPDINDKNKQDLNSLLQHCESLVVSLEKLTANFQKGIILKNDRDSRCCMKESCIKLPPACITHCCVNALHSNCFRKVYNCQMLQNSPFATCCMTPPCRCQTHT